MAVTEILKEEFIYIKKEDLENYTTKARFIPASQPNYPFDILKEGEIGMFEGRRIIVRKE